MTAEAEAEGTEAELQCSELDSLSSFRDVFQDQSKDFWLSSILGQEWDILEQRLQTMRVGSYNSTCLAAEAFNQCYCLRSEHIQQDTDAITKEFGLGHRRDPVRSTDGPGWVFVFMQAPGFSKLYFDKLKAASAKQSSKKRKGTVREAVEKLKNKRTAKTAADEKVDQAWVAKDSTTLTELVEKTERRRKLSAQKSDESVGRGSKEAKSAPPKPSRPPAQGKKRPLRGRDLYLRQVSVIKERLEQVLPGIPRDQLSTSLALDKLEECMQKPKGRFDKFRDEIESILLSFISRAKAPVAALARAKAARSAASKAQEASADADEDVFSDANATASAKEGDVSSDRPLRTALQGAKDSKASKPAIDVDAFTTEKVTPEKHKVQIDAKLESCSNCGTIYFEDSRFCRHCGMKRPDPKSTEEPRSSEEPVEEVVVGDSAGEETSDSEDGDSDAVEVDEYGFQVALSQLRDASAGGRPADAVAVLQTLRRSKPTQELLERGVWEAALTAHQRMAPNKRTARLAKQVRERWRSLRGTAPGSARPLRKKQAPEHRRPRGWLAARRQAQKQKQRGDQQFYDKAFAALAQLNALALEKASMPASLGSQGGVVKIDDD